jgi:hypothetical protein
MIVMVAMAMNKRAFAAAAGEVQVQSIEPERFTGVRLDACDGSSSCVLRIIEQHLQGLANRCLDLGQALEIQVLNIDLAGRIGGAALALIKR